MLETRTLQSSVALLCFPLSVIEAALPSVGVSYILCSYGMTSAPHSIAVQCATGFVMWGCGAMLVSSPAPCQQGKDRQALVQPPVRVRRPQSQRRRRRHRGGVTLQRPQRAQRRAQPRAQRSHLRAQRLRLRRQQRQRGRPRAAQREGHAAGGRRRRAEAPRGNLAPDTPALMYPATCSASLILHPRAEQPLFLFAIETVMVRHAVALQSLPFAWAGGRR